MASASSPVGGNGAVDRIWNAVIYSNAPDLTPEAAKKTTRIIDE